MMKLALFINDSFQFCFFVVQLIFVKRPLFSHKKGKLGTVAVLANGPSLGKELGGIDNSEKFKDVDFIVMNYMAFDYHFLKIKPKHYCFADPMFFQATHRIKDVRRLFEVLNNDVDWKMNIYIPAHNYKQFISFSQLRNCHISIVAINSSLYMGFKKFRNFFYEKGLSCPRIQTVANLAIYVGINYGYENIILYGVDHNFFDSLCVNEKNQLCNKELHFYDNDKPTLKAIQRNDNGRVYKISEYLEDRMYMFKSHDELASYAKYLSVNVVNHTRNSMIDSYKRKNDS